MKLVNESNEDAVLMWNGIYKIPANSIADIPGRYADKMLARFPELKVVDDDIKEDELINDEPAVIKKRGRPKKGE